MRIPILAKARFIRDTFARMQTVQKRILLCLLGLSIFALLGSGGCNTDCLYQSYTKSTGQKSCARVCPLEDEEGNVVLDSNDKVVYESPEKGEDVDLINCDPFRSVTSIGGATTSNTSTTSGSTGSTSG